jgi:hypothetical protein
LFKASLFKLHDELLTDISYIGFRLSPHRLNGDNDAAARFQYAFHFLQTRHRVRPELYRIDREGFVEFIIVIRQGRFGSLLQTNTTRTN